MSESKYPVSDWKYEVENDDTKLGYEEWLKHKEESEQDDRNMQIVELAKCQRERDGDIEFDLTAEVSEGDDNGAYVLAWVWIDFSGTPLDKEAKQ